MLEIRDLHIAYPKSASEAVRGVSFDLSHGRMAGLVGESGSGKTTIVTAVLGLLPGGSRVSGAILFEGRNLLALPEDELRRLRMKTVLRLAAMLRSTLLSGIKTRRDSMHRLQPDIPLMHFVLTLLYRPGFQSKRPLVKIQSQALRIKRF